MINLRAVHDLEPSWSDGYGGQSQGGGIYPKVIPHLNLGVVTHLQYEDDTVILIEPSDLGIANIKLLLLCFKICWG
jgi:hypothetical protein